MSLPSEVGRRLGLHSSVFPSMDGWPDTIIYPVAHFCPAATADIRYNIPDNAFLGEKDCSCREVAISMASTDADQQLIKISP